MTYSLNVSLTSVKIFLSKALSSCNLRMVEHTKMPSSLIITYSLVLGSMPMK